MPVVQPSAKEYVLEQLKQQREPLVETVVAQSRSLEGYVELEPAQLSDFADTVREGFDAVVRAMAGDRQLGDDEVAFLWAHIRRRTEAGVSEADMLSVVRLFQRTLWDAIFNTAGDGEQGREAALALARPLFGYTDALSRAVNEAFADAEEAIATRATAVRRVLVETLLAGGELPPGAALGAARRAGLEGQRPFVVVVARPTSRRTDEAALRAAAVALLRATGSSREPLYVVRADEIVVIQPSSDPAALASSLLLAQQRLSDRGVELAIGVSTVHNSTASVPAAFREAYVAQDQLPASGGVLALSGLGVADYLLLRGGDGTAWRLIAQPVRDFVDEDAAHGGVLSDTLLAYVASDLNVKLAAERLFVHPNTAHYRLAKIEDRTGCSVRRLEDVLLLTIAICLTRAREERPDRGSR
jgi:hypothetical protein